MDIMECDSEDSLLKYLCNRQLLEPDEEYIKISVFDIIVNTFMPSISQLCKIYEWVIQLSACGRLNARFERIADKKYLLISLDTIDPKVGFYFNEIRREGRQKHKK